MMGAWFEARIIKIAKSLSEKSDSDALDLNKNVKSPSKESSVGNGDLISRLNGGEANKYGESAESDGFLYTVSFER